MNADSILNYIVNLVTPTIHKSRRKAVIACVKSLMYGAQGNVTSIGRGIHSNAYEKHNIKRADRLLSNSQLLRELPSIYKAICNWLGKAATSPIIHIDWSDLDPNKRHFLIRASLLFSGRSLTLYQEVHALNTKEKPATHLRFLSKLKDMLGEDIKPIIVTDAGFKVPWFRQVLSLSWDYVGRVRQPNFYKTEGSSWQCISSLYSSATQTPKLLPGELSRSNALATNLVLFKGQPKGRIAKSCFGQKRMNSNQIKYSKRGSDPWLLATSLPASSTLAKRAVNIYYTRMQIEESFRDMKSHKFGLGYMTNTSKASTRVTVLVFLVSLANLVLIMIGLAVDTSGKHRQYQANTVKHKRVLSFHSLGLRAVRTHRFKINKALWKTTLYRFYDYIRALEHET